MHFLGDKMNLKEKGYQLICEKYSLPFFVFNEGFLIYGACIFRLRIEQHLQVHFFPLYLIILFRAEIELSDTTFLPYFWKMVDSMLVVLKMLSHVSSYVFRNSFADVFRHNLLCKLPSCRHCENS